VGGGERKEFVQDGEENEGLVVPIAQGRITVAVVLGFIAEVAGGDRLFDALDEAGVALEVGAHRLVEGTAEELAHARLGLVESATVARNVDEGDGADPGEELEPVTGRALADPEAGDDFVKGAGFVRGKEKTEDLPDGARKIEGCRHLDKKTHERCLDWIETSTHRGLILGFFHLEQISGGKLHAGLVWFNYF